MPFESAGACVTTTYIQFQALYYWGGDERYSDHPTSPLPTRWIYFTNPWLPWCSILWRWKHFKRSVVKKLKPYHIVTLIGSSPKSPPSPNGLKISNMNPCFPLAFPALNLPGFFESKTFVVTFSTLCPMTSGLLFFPIFVCFVTVVTVLKGPFVSVVVSDSVLMPLSSFLLLWLTLGTTVFTPMPIPSGAALSSVLSRLCEEVFFNSWTFDFVAWCLSGANNEKELFYDSYYWLKCIVTMH